MKIGRNSPCWCGSNKKYKKCHLDRDTQEPLSKEVVHKELNRFNLNKCCSVPEKHKSKCSKRIIKAHSVSKSSSLKEIALNGHVLTFFGAFGKCKNIEEFGPIEVGINKASTFSGFCSTHDCEIFSPIENQSFNKSNYHCFLLVYRTISREAFVKNASKGVFGILKDLDRGKSYEEQVYIQNRYMHFNGNNDLTIGDLTIMKNKLDYMFSSDSHSQLQHVIFTLDSPPKVMTSAAFGIMFGFDGSIIQKFSEVPEEIPDYLNINSFSSDGKGYIVFSWLAEHKRSNLELMRTLLKSPSIPDSILVLIISRIENVYICPRWWGSLSSEKKAKLVSLSKKDGCEDTYNDVLIINDNYNAFEYDDYQLIGIEKGSSQL